MFDSATSYFFFTPRPYDERLSGFFLHVIPKNDSINGMKRICRKKHSIRTIFLVLLIFILSIGCFGTTERLSEWIRILNTRQIGQSMPLGEGYQLTRGTFLLQYAREAGGLSGSQTKETIQNSLGLSADLHLRLSAVVLVFLVIASGLISAAFYSRRIMFVINRPELSVITYIHDQDGLK